MARFLYNLGCSRPVQQSSAAAETKFLCWDPQLHDHTITCNSLVGSDFAFCMP